MWTIQQNGDGQWEVRRDGVTVDTFETPEEALARLQAELAAVAADPPTDEPGDGRRSVLLRMIPLGVETSDGRIIESVTGERPPPLPLMLQTVTDVGHFGAELAGVITAVREEAGVVWGDGVTDASEAGLRLAQVLEEHGRFGLSVDVGAMDEVEFECREEDEDGWCVDGLMTARGAEVLGATATPFPAFADAWVELVDTAEAITAAADAAVARSRVARNGVIFLGPEANDPVSPIVATAASVAILPGDMYGAPVEPPAAWFLQVPIDDPDERRMTHVDADGHIWGYAFCWGECHIGYRDVCVTAPRSVSGYAYFATGHTMTAEGERVRTGVITLAGGHAPLNLGWKLAAAHYDDTDSGVADVAVGEDEHGGWFAGAIRPGRSRADVRTVRASGVSGDWREISSDLEMIALPCVNHPGFPKVKVRSRVASGRTVALVAAGGAPVPFETHPLVAAAGRVRRRQSRMGMAATVARLDRVESRLATTERRLALLAPTVRAAMIETVSANGRG